MAKQAGARFQGPDKEPHHGKDFPRRQARRPTLVATLRPPGIVLRLPARDVAVRRAFEALAAKASQDERCESLSKIAAAYGKVAGIYPMPANLPGDAGADLYAVDFERTADALAASRHLKCYLLGFSTLLVSLPQRDCAVSEANPPGTSE